YWDDRLRAYIISESTGKNHGIVGSPAARGISYTPAHMLSDVPNEFKIRIVNPEEVRDRFIPIALAGGKGSRESVIRTYERLLQDPRKHYRKNLEHFRNLQESTLRVTTPSPRLNLAFEWAKVAYDNLMVENPDLGKGLVAGWGLSGTGGRPGFGWFFGGDTFINSFSLLSYGVFTFVRDAIAFTQKWQREDGKMAHELSQAAGYIDWWNDYHYGYIHGDTTPFYIVAMEEYLRATADIGFVKKSWDSLKKAYAWCVATDANSDGLMDNRKAGLGALEYGALTGIETDIYLAGVWTRAAWAMERLARAVGDEGLAAEAAAACTKARKALEEKFWDPDRQIYAYAFDADGKKVSDLSPWSAVMMMWNLADEERSEACLERISAAELATDWGIRSLSVKSPYFGPLNYNYGAVWPFLTTWVCTALYKHHMPLQAYALLQGTAEHTFDNALGSITEVFSGTRNVWPQEACSHQGFSSAGVVLPLVRGLLGLEANALEKTVTFSPHLPADWDHVRISSYKAGQARFTFEYSRKSQPESRIIIEGTARNARGFRIRCVPALGLGARVRTVTLDGHPVEAKSKAKGQVVLVDIEIPVEKEEKTFVLEVSFIETAEILPHVASSRTGDPNRGLKILNLKKQASRLILTVEGLGGTTYALGVRNPEHIARVEGGHLDGESLEVSMPGKRADGFVEYQVILHLKE
ncbi:MAG: amylo-alpha-1,6-glucosidase, partial [Candidatus Aminicenantales bacterium]